MSILLTLAFLKASAVFVVPALIVGGYVWLSRRRWAR